MEDTIQHKWWNLVWICVFQKYVNCIFFDASAKQIMLLFFLFSNFRVCFFFCWDYWFIQVQFCCARGPKGPWWWLRGGEWSLSIHAFPTPPLTLASLVVNTAFIIEKCSSLHITWWLIVFPGNWLSTQLIKIGDVIW